MDLRYTPFDPVVWLIFAGFLICAYTIVRLFHRRYPQYPSIVRTQREEAPVRTMDGDRGIIPAEQIEERVM